MKSRETKLLSKLTYASADIYGGGSFLILSLLYLVFLTDFVKMSPILAGTIPLVGRIWDAVTDPVMGIISDRTKSKYGSKRVYLLFGSFFAGISFVLLWVPIGGTLFLQYVFYLSMYMFFSTAITVVMVPYNALLPDMVEDYTLRGVYTVYRIMFSAISAIISGLLPNIIIGFFAPDIGAGYLVMGVFFGILFSISVLITFFGSWENPKDIVKLKVGEYARELLSVFKNRSFKLFLGIFLLGQGSADFVTGGIIYFLAVVLQRRDYFMPVMSAVLISQIIAMFVHQILLKKWSKKTPIFVGFSIRIVSTMAMFYFAYSGAPLIPIVLLSFLTGIGTAASSVSSFAILPDLTDVDELITGMKRPGIYSGMATFARKIANGVAIWLIGAMLSFFQYNPALAVQSDFTILGVTLMFIPLPILMMIGTIYFTSLFPIDKLTFKCLKAEIKRRQNKQGDNASEQDIKICESITGWKYDSLWRKENARI